jgi:UDP-glucose 4-epimerase
MKILITGISGFIGSAVYKNFLKNFEIYTVDNLSFGNRSLIDIPDENFFVEDIRNRRRIFELFDKIQPDYVIHLAAIHFIPYCNEHPFESAEVNIEGTKNIFDACESTKSVKKVLYASTAAVYPIIEEAITENHPTSPMDIYGITKLTGEYIASAFHQKTNIPTIVCRFFNAFGPNETNPHLIPAIQEQINAGLRKISLGNLEPKRDYIHTSDMANAIEGLMSKFTEGFDIFNLGQGIEYSVTEIVDAFAECLNENIEIVQDPLRMRKSDRLHLLADNTKLKNFLNWEPKTSIEDGIKTLLSNV